MLEFILLQVILAGYREGYDEPNKRAKRSQCDHDPRCECMHYEIEEHGEFYSLGPEPELSDCVTPIQWQVDELRHLAQWTRFYGDE
tara:strand:+ start:11930 stop:12187 length:258 start_codon:yes stop_codon:yes gene_type:complete